MSTDPQDLVDVVVVGAGFSGLYALHRLRGAGLRVTVVEQADDVGGTWYWNRYPGARCDIESIDYCYSFSPELVEEWSWSERYAAQPEILRYLQHVADRFDLRRDIRFRTRVEGMRWDDDDRSWTVVLSDGVAIRSRFCVMAVGNLSEPKKPDLPGVDSFAGPSYLTARWPHEGVDFSGLRVGVFGTGSSGIQAIPRIAEQADHLYVFQRTPNYSMPARNRPLAGAELVAEKEGFAERRAWARASEAGVPFPAPDAATFDVHEAERERRFEAGWQRGGINALSYAFTDYFTSEAANLEAQRFARRKIRETVRDPRTAEALCPSHHIGTKRTCVDTGYFETYNRDNVTLVDLRTESLDEFVPAGVRTSAREYSLDCLVFALGFDAMTGALLAMDIVGTNGLSLGRAWRDGPSTYLGLAVAGFPNMFVVTGPGSPGVLSNMVVSIEQHVDWVADCLAVLRRTSIDRIEAMPQAQERWGAHVRELADRTLYPAAASWYLGANVPGKPRVFMPYVDGCATYRTVCDDVARDGYRGFRLGLDQSEPTTA